MQNQKIILFDAQCKLCSAWCNFVIAHDPSIKFKLCSVQSPAGQSLLAQFGFSTTDFTSMPVVSGNLQYQQNLEVIARAPLEYYQFVYPGLELNLSAGATRVIGRVRTVVAVGDEFTHQFELRIDVDGAPFPVGQTLRVAVPMSAVRDALAVPRDALVLRPDGVTVFVVDANDMAKQVPVTTGVGSGDRIEVIGAVAAGDLTPGEGGALAGLVETYRRALETEDLERRVTLLEDRK